jgi:hypothetical protein
MDDPFSTREATTIKNCAHHPQKQNEKEKCLFYFISSTGALPGQMYDLRTTQGVHRGHGHQELCPGRPKATRKWFFFSFFYHY